MDARYSYLLSRRTFIISQGNSAKIPAIAESETLSLVMIRWMKISRQLTAGQTSTNWNTIMVMVIFLQPFAVHLHTAKRSGCFSYSLFVLSMSRNIERSSFVSSKIIDLHRFKLHKNWQYFAQLIILILYYQRSAIFSFFYDWPSYSEILTLVKNI